MSNWEDSSIAFDQFTAWHNEPGRHRFGEALFLPSVPKGVSAAGNLVGTSDAPARADHTHGYASEAWLTYTPQIDQSNTNIAKTVEQAIYQKVGRTCHLIVGVTTTAAGVAGNDITISIPFAPATQYMVIGTMQFWDASSFTRYVGIVEIVPTLQSKVRFATDTSSSAYLGTTPSIALANNDTLRFGITYQTAS